MRTFVIKHCSQLLLALIILAQLGYTTYVFAFEKQGARSDEILSYGLANGYEQPFIYLRDGVHVSQAQESDIINCNQWIPGEEFFNYIAVQDGEQFSYNSVWHNLSLDYHPPLYYALLHTVCSLFQNQFSFWFAYLLSIVSLIGTQVFLYLFTTVVTRKKSIGLLTCVLYAGGNGALNTFLYLRQYHLLTMLTVAFAWLSALCMEQLHTRSSSQSLCNRKSRLSAGLMIATAFTAFLLFLSHYTGIIYVGIFTALFCLWMCWKDYRYEMFLYGGCMIAALLASIVVFPSIIAQLSADSDSVTTLFSFPTQMRLLLNNITQYSLGFKIDMFGTAFWRILPLFLLLGLVLLALLLFPFRHETWFHQTITLLKDTPAHLAHFIKNANYLPVIAVIAAFTLLPCAALTSDIYRMGNLSIRYVIPCIPFACFVAVSLTTFVIEAIFHFIQKLLPKCKSRSEFLQYGIVAVIICAILVRVSIISDCPFIIQHYGNYEDASELLAGKNVLIIGSEQSDVWMLTCYCPYVRDAAQVFYTTADTIEDYTDEIEALEKSIDYCLVTAGTIDLTEEENKMVTAWYDDGEPDTETDTMGASIIVDEEDDSDADEPAECGSVIRGLSNGGDYTLLFGMNIQGGLVYVLEIK